MAQSGEVIVNELLFYIQNKIHATTKDTIVDSCVKFYSLDEITKSISVLETALKIRLSKRKQSDDLQTKLINDLYDKIWSLDAAGTQIPHFAALDLARVPRERENSESLASTEQLLASIHNLKSIVYHLRDNMVTRDFLASSLASCASSSASPPPPASHPLSLPPPQFP